MEPILIIGKKYDLQLQSIYNTQPLIYTIKLCKEIVDGDGCSLIYRFEMSDNSFIDIKCYDKLVNKWKMCYTQNNCWFRFTSRNNIKILNKEHNKLLLMLVHTKYLKKQVNNILQSRNHVLCDKNIIRYICDYFK